jgi:hypothetical protein
MNEREFNALMFQIQLEVCRRLVIIAERVDTSYATRNLWLWTPLKRTYLLECCPSETDFRMLDTIRRSVEEQPKIEAATRHRQVIETPDFGRSIVLESIQQGKKSQYVENY